MAVAPPPPLVSLVKWIAVGSIRPRLDFPLSDSSDCSSGTYISLPSFDHPLPAHPLRE